MKAVRFELRPATMDEIFQLRWEILRPNRPRESAQFAGDDAPSTRHFASWENGRVVGCLTFHASEWKGQTAWQLRGMAIAADCQRQGAGRALLEFAEKAMHQESFATLLWCNARISSFPFYEQQGWQIMSEKFDIPDVGPHVRMIKRL